MIRRGHRKARRLTELRMAELERQMSHIEDVTGCHTDEELPDVEDPTVMEMLAAQSRIIQHLLITLDAFLPGFSIEAFRSSLPHVDAALTERGDIQIEQEDRERLLRIIDGLIPGSRRRDAPAPHLPGRFRPTLVPKAPEQDERD